MVKIVVSEVGSGIADFGVKKITQEDAKRYAVEPNTHYNFYRTLDGEFVAFSLLG
jgi:hypothetical protein